MLTKISKIARFIILLLFFSIGLIYILFRSYPVQTWIIHKAADYLSDELKTKVKIGSVNIDFFKTAVFENVYIEDQSQDTLFYFRKIKVDFNAYDKVNKKITLNRLGLEGGKILFGTHKGDTTNNYNFFIDYFDAGPRDTTKPRVIWTVFSKQVDLINNRFDFFDENSAKPDFMDFNYNDISFNHIDANLSEFYLIDDSLSFFTNHLETKEKSGIKIIHMQANTKIHAKGVELASLLLNTENSTLSNYFSMETKNWKSYNNFFDQVFLKANLINSEVHSKDLAYFSHFLKNYNTNIKINGDANGTVSNLKGKNTELTCFNQTKFKGDWSIMGLPNVDDALIDFDVKELFTDIKDIEQISLNTFPSNIKALGKINYKGKFTGFYNDFVAFGNVKTNIGEIDADINLKFKEGIEKAKYSGKLKTNQFQLNMLYPQTQINDLAFDLKLKGTSFDPKKFELNLNGQISKLNYQNYTYKNIEVNGDIAPYKFNGIAKVNDPHLAMDFNGEFNYQKKNPEAKIKAIIQNIDLSSLGFDTIEQNIKGTFNVDFVGSNLDNAIGKIIATDLTIKRNNKTVFIPEISIKSEQIRKTEKKLTVQSSFLNAELEGNYNISKLDKSLYNFVYQLIPVYFDKPKNNVPNQDFKFDIDLINPTYITDLYLPFLTLSPCIVTGSYHSTNGELYFKTENQHVTYDDYEIDGVKIVAQKEKNSELKVNLLASHLKINNTINSNNISIESFINENSIKFHAEGKDTGFKLSLDSKGELLFTPENLVLKLQKTNLGMDNKVWVIDSSTNITILDDKIKINQMNLVSENQKLKLEGNYSKDFNDSLKLDLENLNLSYFNYLMLKNQLQTIGGISNGSIDLKFLNNSPVVTTNIEIESLKYDKDTLGDLKIKTSGLANSSVQDIDVKVIKGLLDSLELHGKIDYKSKTNNLDLVASIPSSDLKVGESFMKGIFSQIKGSFNFNDIKIKGTFDKPEVKGVIHVNNANMLIDYLNVPVSFDTKIYLEKNKIYTNDFAVYDEFKSSGKANFQLTHQYFDAFKMNLVLEDVKNFQVMNTSSVNNSLYYGKAFADLKGSIKGPFDNLDIYIQAKTLKNTKFILPISEGDASGLPSYVHFKSNKKRIKKQESEFPIRSLVLNIEATEDANVEIVFDETLGDKISGNGYGNLKMEMNKSADFYMFGTYTISSGKYLFTAFDLYNKPFNIKQGGTVSWTGDPYNAQINIAAFNSEKANPAPLITSANANAANTSSLGTENITVESLLFLKGNLFSPEITFGLEFPKIQTELRQGVNDLTSVISRIKSDKEEVARQVFSLLMLRSFLPPTFSQNTQSPDNIGSTVISSAGSDLLSSQLSNWLSKIDPNWKINIIYKNGSITLPPEYGIGLSKQFFKNKLLIDGTISNYNNNSIPNINVEYKVTQKGNFRLKAYSRSNLNQVNTTTLNTPITTWGIGIIYTKDFDKFMPEIKKKSKKKSKKKKKKKTKN